MKSESRKHYITQDGFETETMEENRSVDTNFMERSSNSIEFTSRPIFTTTTTTTLNVLLQELQHTKESSKQSKYSEFLHSQRFLSTGKGKTTSIKNYYVRRIRVSITGCTEKDRPLKHEIFTKYYNS